ncbi:hypothetical protein [Marinibacterium profundimaris]|uniref:Uncharacterized protein n=1 Tax=Marinibacterium profundimaris TaxID=1679460 RepID=A0A225NF07_9RHOB|nr:hypothetical protein [Marinibacterium profundimaris]OWU67815.1 hypothetical protein ATO3_25645 [Marinibacterium profundimaris]
MQVETTSFPDFPKVCGKSDREFEHLLEGCFRLARSFGFFSEQQLFLFDLPDFLFIRLDDRAGVRLHETGEQGFDLRIQFLDLAGIERGILTGAVLALIPRSTEHALGNRELRR